MAFNLVEPSHHDVYPYISPTEGLSGVVAGKAILVTGAGTGIGRAIAESFAKAGAASVTIASRREAPLQGTASLIAQHSSSCKVVVRAGTDITSQSSVDALFASLPSPPDVLVSNAAKVSSAVPIADSDPEKWWSDHATNMFGTYLLNRAYLRQIAASSQPGKKFKIINVSSAGSHHMVPLVSAYTGSKVALNNFCEHVDRENEHVTCIAMHPGGVAATELTAEMGVPESLKRRLIDKPALAGGTAVFLSTERAEFLGGRYVNCTWDMEQLVKVEDRVVKEQDLLKNGILGIKG